MVPNNSVALTREIKGDFSVPLATVSKNSALTLAASSTPAGTRLVISSISSASLPAGGLLSSFTNSAV